MRTKSPLTWTAPFQAPKTIHDIVEEVYARHYPPDKVHLICQLCGKCMSCDLPHICINTTALAA